MKCLICSKELKNFLSLPSHLRIHNINTQKYYDRYFRNYSCDEGFCLNCGKETKFYGLKKKYSIYCSIKCGRISNITREKLKKTCIKKYGTDHHWKNKNIIEKRAITWLEKYGTKHPMQTDVVKENFKLSCLKTLGVDHPWKSEKTRNKIREACLEKYGVEQPLQSEKIRDKIKKTLLKNKNISTKNNLPLFDFYFTKLGWAQEIRKNQTDNDILEVKCKKCGKWFIPKINDLNNRVQALKGQSGTSENNLYCSADCKQTCSIYRQINYQRNQNPNSDRPWHSEWALEVKRIANYECEICGSKNDLTAHHILPVKTHSYLQADIDNGICLCKDCHMKYGHKDECSTGNLARKIC